jgi:hypothetical protein
MSAGVFIVSVHDFGILKGVRQARVYEKSVADS